MALYVARQSDKTFLCPKEDCVFRTKHGSSLRAHCSGQHGIKVTTVRPLTKELEAQRKMQQRQRMRKLRTQREIEKQTAALSSKRRRFTPQRARFNWVDADERGTHLAEDPLVMYATSLIPMAGNGIFACVPLFKGDVVTRYEGTRVTKVPAEPEYTIEIDTEAGGKYLDGIRVPQKDLGLGSFVNKESRAPGLKRKNCEMIQVGLSVYIEMVTDVAAGDELYTTYSKGYRIT